QTVQQHILEEQRRHHPDASGEFSWLLSGITLATKIVAAQVRRAGLVGIVGVTRETNVQGEQVQKLDVIANDTLLQFLGNRGNVAIMASEENEHPVIVERDRQRGKYVVVFDPLDGSSNIDVNVSVGTIFSILRRDPDPTGKRDVLADVLQPGTKQVAAGNGVHGFTLDPSIGAYLMSHENMRMPPAGKIYSCNEANSESFPPAYQDYLHHLRSGATGRTYSSRYIGSLVADFHRTLLKGGIFLYPPTQAHPKGKLRLLYEANPMAFLAEQAGGLATDGKGRILDICPESLHQRTPLIVGSREEEEMLTRFVAETKEPRR